MTPNFFCTFSVEFHLGLPGVENGLPPPYPVAPVYTPFHYAEGPQSARAAAVALVSLCRCSRAQTTIRNPVFSSRTQTGPRGTAGSQYFCKHAVGSALSLFRVKAFCRPLPELNQPWVPGEVCRSPLSPWELECSLPFPCSAVYIYVINFPVCEDVLAESMT